MKIITATILALLISLQIMAGKVIKNPEIEYASSWMTITEIELTKEATIIRGILSKGSSVINNTILKNRYSEKEYKLLRIEGIKTNEQASDETVCSIYFEPLDANVKEFNYIEVGNNPFGNYYGIKLKQKEKASKKKKKMFDPESLDYDYYMSQSFTPDTTWHFSNLPYKNGFESGKAQIKIYLTKIPREIYGLLPNASARVTDQITRHEENVTATIDENNCYTLNLNLPHAQFAFVQPLGNIFIAPGDTLEVFSTIETTPDSREFRFKTFRSKSESALINTLLPKFIEKYGKKEYDYKKATAMIEKGKDATQSTLERWANQINDIIADEEFRQALINSPLSTVGKDLIMMSAVANKCIEIQDVVMFYTHKKNIQTQLEDGSWKIEVNPNYVPLDLKSVYDTQKKNKELIYNNPLAISESSQWAFVNRTLYSPLLRNMENITDEHGNIIDQHRYDNHGMAGTFMNDLYLSQDIVFRMEHTLKKDKLGQLGDYRTRIITDMANHVGKALAGIQNEKVAQIIVNEYRNFVKATDAGTTDTSNNWTEEQNALWNKIVSPYKGNTLFLDFWGMGCGPCRAGMISQKKIVEEMKDESVKFIYITTEDQKAAGEKWMDEKNIKGEHVYITGNEWKQLESMINFTAIPRGALVNKNGKLIESDFHVGQYSSTDLKKIVEKF